MVHEFLLFHFQIGSYHSVENVQFLFVEVVFELFRHLLFLLPLRPGHDQLRWINDFFLHL
ncbi:MAG: hypothetical protein EA360_01850 [Balneolaceae bacterium]|nr:MAG: hypothetical protein EA360_01850 [Balneolaceae bacterium]